jgi:hypothetical protein
MDVGYYERESRNLLRERELRYALIKKGTPEEQSRLKELWLNASRLAGRDWCEFSDLETTDKGIEESAKLLSEFRILLANIRHREEGYEKEARERNS